MNKDSIIQKRSLAEEVAQRLQEQIADRQFMVGEKLPTEPELMKKFGVGRSTIREAVKILSNSGFLNVLQGVGTFVESVIPTNESMGKRLQRADIQELNEVRQMLEVKMAEKAAERRTEQDILNIEKHLSERKIAGEAGLLEKCIETDLNFHIAIAEASHNEIFLDLYKLTSIYLQKWFKDLYNDTSPLMKTHALHEQLAKNIIAGEPKKARQTVEEIIKES